MRRGDPSRAELVLKVETADERGRVNVSVDAGQGSLRLRSWGKIIDPHVDLGRLVQVDGIDSAGPRQGQCPPAHAFECERQRILEQVDAGATSVVNGDCEGHALEKEPGVWDRQRASEKETVAWRGVHIASQLGRFTMTLFRLLHWHSGGPTLEHSEGCLPVPRKGT